jgi:anti-sigma regulatory factor (Ser/Thr protein kinase)
VETSVTARDSSLELAALPNAVGLARRHTAALLTEWSVAPAVIEAAVLLVSELATNAVPRGPGSARRLTYPELGGVRCFRLRLRMKPDGSGLLIEVRDNNPGAPQRKAASPDAESGRGLFIVEALSRDWGYSLDGPFKTVWCEMECAIAS